MKKLLLSAITASMLLSTTGIAKEQAAKDATVGQVNQIAISNAKEDARNSQKKLVQEAIESLKYTQSAVINCDQSTGVCWNIGRCRCSAENCQETA